MTPQRLTRAVLIVTVALVAASLLRALLRPASGLVDGTGMPPAQFVANLRAGQTGCDRLGTPRGPADTFVATVGTYNRGPQPLLVTVHGAPATVLRNYRSGVVQIPLSASARSGGGVACLRNLGRYRVAVAGVSGGTATLDGVRRSYALSFALRDNDPPTWYSEVPTVLDRAGKAAGAPLGRMTGWAAAALVAGTLVIALVAGFRFLAR